MELRGNRAWYGETFCGGILRVNGREFCKTMEDRVREPGVKIDGKTAIPAGRYRVELTMSNRFKKITPELLAVPMFAGIRIHPGNTEADTEGCILVGMAQRSQMESGRIFESRTTFELLMSTLRAADARKEEIWITIV